MIFWKRARCSGHFTGFATHSSVLRSMGSEAVAVVNRATTFGMSGANLGPSVSSCGSAASPRPAGYALAGR